MSGILSYSNYLTMGSCDCCPITSVWVKGNMLGKITLCLSSNMPMITSSRNTKVTDKFHQEEWTMSISGIGSATSVTVNSIAADGDSAAVEAKESKATKL